MYTIRIGVFETNSSMSHSLTVCTEEAFNEWRHNYLYLANDTFCTKEEVIQEISKYEKPTIDFSKMDNELFDDIAASYEYYSYRSYYRRNFDCPYDFFDKSFTTPKGEKMVAFGVSTYQT